MDVWDTLECLEMIQDYINCKTARMKALGSLGFSDNIMNRGMRVLHIVIMVMTMFMIFLKLNEYNDRSAGVWCNIIIRGVGVYFLLYLFVYVPFGGLLFLFCKKRQRVYRRSEKFLRAKQNFEFELEKIAKNLKFLHQQLENSKVPEKYRNYHSVLFLRDALDGNKAKDLEEAISLYEDFVVENNLQEKLHQDNQNLLEKLAEIQNVSQEIEKAANQDIKGLKFLKAIF